ncbi:MAG TPA: MraY family glycosyltransferase [Pyrinomonadaceae bacterium]
MNTYLALFLIALCSSLVLTPLLRRLCERLGWLDAPRDERPVHRRAVPRLGGVAIFVSVLIALSTIPLVDNLVTQFARANFPKFLMIFVPGTLVLLFGIYDDLRGSRAWLKFSALILAGAVLYFMGGRIEALSVPFVGSVVLPQAVGFALTILWVVGVANAFNLIDGIDGLATGAALFSALVILVVSFILGHPLATMVALVLSGALIGFLRYNFNPASIFLGDSGSLFIGFTLAAISLEGSQKASTAIAISIPLMAFGLPVIDTGFAMVRRFLSGRPVFQGDQEHIHHMLLARGWSQRRAVFVLYGVCAALGLASLLFVNESSRVTGLVLLVVGSALVLALGRLQYHEVDEVKASMKRNLGERRRRARNHLRIRRASRAISKAASLGEVFAAVREMLELGEFAHATARIGRGGDIEGNAQALARENNSTPAAGLELRGGMICWSWEREGVKSEEIIGSGRFWTLRLPLSTERAGWGYINLYRGFDGETMLLDINYLCNLFQREMAQAVERIMLRAEEEAVEVHLALSAAAATSGD